MEVWLLSARDIIPNAIFTLYNKPKKVTIFTSKWKIAKTSAKNQKKVFEQRKIETKIVEIPTYDSKKIVGTLDETVKKEKTDLSKVKFLTNCATKFTVEVINKYVKSERGESLYLVPGNIVAEYGGRFLYKMEKNVLTINDFLNLNNFIITEYQTFEKLPDNKKTILLKFYKKLIKFSKLCESNEKKVKSFIKQERNILKGNFSLFYPNSSRNFTNSGIALEFLAYQILKNSNIFDGIKANIKISNQANSKIQNEVDLVAIKNNLLYYFSCKKRKKINSDEHLHRISSLSKRLGGKYTIPVLITCIEAPTIKEKANSYGINYITPKELIQFEKEPEKFINEWKKLSIPPLID